MKDISDRVWMAIMSKEWLDRAVAWHENKEHNTSRSAKPGQAHIPASPCPADTLSTPPNSRHPGANDGEVRKHTASEAIE